VISVDASSASTPDIGLTNFVLTATLAGYPTKTQTYNFSVTISCILTSVTPSVPVLTGSHTLETDIRYYSLSQFAIPAFTYEPAVCFTGTPVFTLFDYTSGVQVTAQAYSTLSGSALVVDTQDITLAGLHTFKIIATVPNTAYLTGTTGSMMIDVDFRLGCSGAILIPATQSFGKINYTLY
jgi:hypothetical protein